MPEPLIQIDALSYIYEPQGADPVQALDGISATIHTGAFVAIVGPNGSGKSTLAKCLNGLLRPTRGRVCVAGWDTSEAAHLLDIRATVAMAFQNPDNQFVATTVQEEVAFGPENLGVAQPELGERVHQALQDTDLDQRRDDNPRLLSAGEKARLAVAGLLAMRPRCLVLDESTAMLDPYSRANMRALLRRLHQSGLTIALITHYMDEAADAEQVMVLQEGQLKLHGTPREVLTQAEALRSIGLAPPPAITISNGLARRGLALAPALNTDDLLQALLAQREMAHG